MKKTIISFLFLLVCGMAHSQVLAKGPEESYNADSIRAILDKSPYFTLFKDNYFIGGRALGPLLAVSLSATSLRRETPTLNSS